MPSAAISVTGLTKRFGARTAVDNLDLELPTGVVAGFVGPNGAGKTTTMAMLLGLVRPTAGSATVLGSSIDNPAAYLGRVGALIETPAFYPALSGRDNLRLFATVGGQDQSRIPTVLDIVGLTDRSNDRFGRYSLGMKQRLGIAAALLGDPDLLILDEPANGLDPQGVREMRELISGLAGTGRTVLVSSHDLSELEQVCDWLVLIDTGRSLYQGPTSALLDDAGASLTVAPRRQRDAGPLSRVLANLGHAAVQHGPQFVIDLNGGDASEVAAEVNRAAFDAGVVLAELTPQRTSLEDRYLSLVERSAS